MLVDPNRESKFAAKYLGPYTVVKHNKRGLYSLRDNTMVILGIGVFLVDQLKLISVVLVLLI